MDADENWKKKTDRNATSRARVQSPATSEWQKRRGQCDRLLQGVRQAESSHGDATKGWPKKRRHPASDPHSPPKATPNPNAPCEWSGRKCTVHSLIAGHFVVARVPRRKSGRLFSEWTLGSPSTPVPGFKQCDCDECTVRRRKKWMGRSKECDNQRKGNCTVRIKKKNKKLQGADMRDGGRDECTVRVELRVRRNERVHGASENKEPNALRKGNKSTEHAMRVMNAQCR